MNIPIPRSQEATFTQRSPEQLMDSLQALNQEIIHLLSQIDGNAPLDITYLQAQLAGLTQKLEMALPSTVLKTQLETFDPQLSQLIKEFSLKCLEVQQKILSEDRRHQGIQAYRQNSMSTFRGK